MCPDEESPVERTDQITPSSALQTRLSGL